MKNFLVEGYFIEKGEKKKFSKKISAISESFAAEKALCLFGSKHKIKRRGIFINEIKELEEQLNAEKKKKN